MLHELCKKLLKKVGSRNNIVICGLDIYIVFIKIMLVYIGGK